MNRRTQIEFETLSGKLLSGEATNHDLLLLEEITSRSPALAERLKVLNEIAEMVSNAGRSEETEKQTTPEKEETVVLPFSRKNYIPLFSGIAATILVFLGISYTFLFRDPLLENASGFVSGNEFCFVDGKALPEGKPVDLYQTVTVGPKSLCRLTSGHEGRIEIRLQDEALAILDRENGNPVVVRNKGTLSIESEKQEQGEQISLVTGDTKITLLGTKVLISEIEGKTSAEVLEGKVSVTRSAANFLYGEKSESVKEMREKLQKEEKNPEKEMILESGEGVRLPETSVSNKQREILLNWVETDSGRMEQKPDFPAESLPEENRYSLEKEEINERLNFFQGSKPVRIKPSISSKTQNPPNNRSESLLQPNSFGFKQTIQTKDGRKLTGTLKEAGNDYIIHTDRGTLRIPRSEVESIGFASE